MLDESRISITASDAVKATGLGKTTMWQLLRSGELPSVKVCGRRLIMVEDLKKFLLKHREKVS